MYRAGSCEQLEFPNFYLPFAGQLDPDNRWIALARLVPWTLADEIYRESLCVDFGAPALSARVALGSLLIKERLGLTDRCRFVGQLQLTLGKPNQRIEEENCPDKTRRNTPRYVPATKVG